MRSGIFQPDVLYRVWSGVLGGGSSTASIQLLMFISHEVIRYESIRGDEIDRTKPNLTGNMVGEIKQGK